MKLLIIEDNRDFLDNLLTYLGRMGYRVETAADYEEGLNKIVSFTYDVVLIDIMIPKGNGLQLLRELKSIRPKTGTIIISAKNALEDKITGLDLGADDYLTKPFQLPELHARIRAVYRRNHLAGKEIITFRELTMNTQIREVFVNDQFIDLTPKEYDLLLYFTSNVNRVLSKQNIAEHLWGDYVDQLENLDFVYQHIKNLRKKLMNAGFADYIVSVYSIGYKLSDRIPSK